MQQITLPADIQHIGEATAFVYEMLDQSGCPQRTRTQIDVALDELLSNVARYAYPPKTGSFNAMPSVLTRVISPSLTCCAPALSVAHNIAIRNKFFNLIFRLLFIDPG